MSKSSDATFELPLGPGYDPAVARNQRNEAFETPDIGDIPGLTAMHVDLMEQSDADEVWVAAGMNHLLLRTVGRRSGNVHKVALPYWVDEDGHRIVVASFAGSDRSPAWFHNLADKAANAEVRVQDRATVWWSDAEVLDGDDYETVWAGLTADRAYYNDYAAKTTRRIPLIRLPETRVGEDDS